MHVKGKGLDFQLNVEEPLTPAQASRRSFRSCAPSERPDMDSCWGAVLPVVGSPVETEALQLNILADLEDLVGEPEDEGAEKELSTEAQIQSMTSAMAASGEKKRAGSMSSAS